VETYFVEKESTTIPIIIKVKRKRIVVREGVKNFSFSGDSGGCDEGSAILGRRSLVIGRVEVTRNKKKRKKNRIEGMIDAERIQSQFGSNAAAAADEDE